MLISQHELIQAVIRYFELLKENASKEEQDDIEHLIGLIKGGACSGIAILWAFATLISGKPKKSIDEKRDDLLWLQKTIESFLTWDKMASSLTTERKQEFDRFINHIIFYQAIVEYLSMGHSALDKMQSLDAAQNKIKKEQLLQQRYSIAGTFTQNGFTCLLKDLDLQPGDIVYITAVYGGSSSSAGHATMLMVDYQGHYLFLNANRMGIFDEGLASFCPRLEEVSEVIFAANLLESHQLSPIALKIFNIDEQTRNIYRPPQEQLLKKYAKQNCPKNSIDKIIYFFQSIKDYFSWGRKPNQDILSLALAAQIGCHESAEYFVTQYGGWSEIIKNDCVFDLFYWAAMQGDVEYIKTLKNKLNDNGIDINKTNTKGETLLIYALNSIGSRNVETIRILIENGVDVNKANKEGWTPLYTAASTGNVSAIKILLEHGADINRCNEAKKDSLTPLYIASQNEHTEAVKTLLDQPGVDVNKANKEGWTPLHVAATKGSLKNVTMLVSKGADIKRVTRDGYTPLRLAVKYRRVNIVEELLASGADPREITNMAIFGCYLSELTKSGDAAKQIRKLLSCKKYFDKALELITRPKHDFEYETCLREAYNQNSILFLKLLVIALKGTSLTDQKKQALREYSLFFPQESEAQAIRQSLLAQGLLTNYQEKEQSYLTALTELGAQPPSDKEAAPPPAAAKKLSVNNSDAILQPDVTSKPVSGV